MKRKTWVQHSILAEELASAIGPELAVSVLEAVSIEAPSSPVGEEVEAGPTAVQEEVGRLVNVYQRLQELLPQAEAMETMRRVIVRAGVELHRARGGPLLNNSSVTREQVQAGFPKGLEYWGIEGEFQEFEPGERFSFRVNRCTYYDELREAGAPELAPFFCEGDAVHYAAFPSICFERSAMIAHGAGHCQFDFSRHQAAGSN